MAETDSAPSWPHLAFLATAGARALELAWMRSVTSNERLRDHAFRAIKLGRQFGSEPDQMGPTVATGWQESAHDVYQAGEFFLWQTQADGLIISMAAQVAGIVNETAIRLGGEGKNQFGFGLLVPEDAQAVVADHVASPAELEITTAKPGSRVREYWLNLAKPRKWRRELGRPPRIDTEPHTMVEFLFARARDFAVPIGELDEIRRWPGGIQ